MSGAWNRSVLRSLLVLGAGALGVHCSVARPFRATELLEQTPKDRQVLVVLTYAELDPKTREPFDDYVRLLDQELDQKSTPGLLGYALRKEVLGDRAWTMTAWQDEASMQRFLRGDTHVDAVADASEAVTCMKFQKLSLPAQEVPLSWDRAEALFAAIPCQG